MGNPNWRTVRVLFIEDQPTIRFMVKRLLAGLDLVDVEDAPNGEAGLAAMTVRPPDLILTDISMEPVNGLEVIKRVRSGEAGIDRDVPIAVLTGYSEDFVVGTALALDADAFILKPVSGAGLEKRLSRVIGRRTKVASIETYRAVDLPSLDENSSAEAAARSVGIPVAAFKPPPSKALVQRLIQEVPPGATLARDIRTGRGAKVLTAGTILDEAMLAKLGDLFEMEVISGSLPIFMP